ncbi:hypothetical protein RB195_001793 [Necator americanus]|uniref:Uncharacterized protein n=1 Tax=Necator americanus TaxID=51031 RepID=A0ABR1DGB6_NECAM
MWTPFVVAVVLVAVSRVEGRPNLDLHDAHAMFPRSLKSFWHLNNRGLAMERLFNGLNVKRPQRAVVAASAHGISQPRQKVRVIHKKERESLLDKSNLEIDMYDPILKVIV